MPLPLEKQRKLELSSNGKKPLQDFSVAVDWGKIENSERNFLGIKTHKSSSEIELDLTCIMYSKEGKVVDNICPPKYNSWLIQNNFPLGKTESRDHAFKQFDETSNHEIPYKKRIDIDVNLISSEISKITFYLNFDLLKIKNPHFSKVNDVKLFLSNDVSHENFFFQFPINTNKSEKDRGILILGTFFKENETWSFETDTKTLNEKAFVRHVLGF